MCFAVHIEPMLRKNLGGRDFFANLWMKNLRASTRNGTKTTGLQPLQALPYRNTCIAGNPMNFDRCHPLQQHARQHLSREREEILIVGDIQLRNHSPHNM